MIRLLIEGMETALPTDFSFTLYVENPIYTKNGQYTYDLTLSLNNPRNARIYKYIDRVNIKDGIQYNRSAILIVDNKIRLNGTEVILGFSGSDVKIQLASGNSELNFLIGGDKSLRSLDLGKAEKYPRESSDGTPIETLVWNDVQKTYPERNWNLLPYSTGYLMPNDLVQPGYNTLPILGNLFMIAYPPSYTSMRSGQVPQPYLCFIIQQVIEVLGYTLLHNSLAEHDQWKYAYIVNGIQTFEFSKMLPDWTVNEFLTKIEQFFNCTFIVNSYNKMVRLIFNYEAYDEEIFPKKQINTVDEYEEETDNENSLEVQNSNIGYSLDDNIYSRFMQLSQRIKLLSKYVESEYTLPLLQNNLNSKDIDVIFKPKDMETLFVLYTNGSNELSLKKVDSFRSSMNNHNSDKLNIEFDIIPASMVYCPIQSTGGSYYWIQAPSVEDYDELFPFPHAPGVADPTEKVNIQEMIEGDGETESDVIPSKIRLAFYSGINDVSGKSNNLTASYPVCYVEYLEECFAETGIRRYYGPVDEDPFRLENMDKNIYSRAESIDTTRTYKFSFELEDDFDIQSIFIIRNKKFICSKVEKEVTIDGFRKYALGYFYPVEKKEEA